MKLIPRISAPWLFKWICASKLQLVEWVISYPKITMKNSIWITFQRENIMSVRQLTTHFEELIKSAETNVRQLFDEKNQNVENFKQKIETIKFEPVTELPPPPPPKPPKVIKEQIVPRDKGQITHTFIIHTFLNNRWYLSMYKPSWVLYNIFTWFLPL